MSVTRKTSWKWEEDGTTVIRSIARTGPGCHEGCGVLLYVKGEKLVKVEGDPNFPSNQGRLCPRCLALPQVVYHADRLKYPLKRMGERGEGIWKRITWDEAYETIAKKFNQIKREHGAESVIFGSGTARDIGPYLARLHNTFGSVNRVGFLQGHACFVPKIATMAALIGNSVVADCAQFFADRYENPNWKVPKCILVWGNEPTISSPDGFMGHWVIDCMKQGSDLIVIDPKKTWLATRAKIWMQIRPGTDAALALGMLHVVINEKLYDERFVEEWTYGFPELKRRVQEYPPEKVAEITWIPRDEIIEAARMYATGKPAALQWGVAVEQTKECVPTLQALIALWTVTGNLDAPGGNVICSQLFGLRLGQLDRWGSEFLTEEQKKKRIGLGTYPFLDWAGVIPREPTIDQLLSGTPYPIKGAWLQACNPIACSGAFPKRILGALRRLDFIVVVDLFMTPTAMALADIVLPAATYAERDGIAITGGHGTYVGTINKAIEPVGECKSDMEINLELGKRLNPEAWPWKDVRQMCNAILKTTGMTFEELRDKGYVYDNFQYKKHEKGLLRPDKKPGFNTPTGKVELYSTVLGKCGLDPLPYFEEPPESPLSTPEIAKDYPLILTTGARTWGFFHSEHRHIPLLRWINPDPITEIHPQTAEKLGIKDGDWIYIESKYGKCKQRAKLTSGIHLDVVHSQHAWWFPEKPGPEPSLFGVWESNINLLLPPRWTGKSGFGYPYKAQLCRVYKAEEA